MNRPLKILVFLLSAAGFVAAQQAPTDIHYYHWTQHTYLLTPPGLSAQTARAYAHSLGGNLVAIGGWDEQSFLITTYAGLQQPLWIGLSDAASEGTYVWDNGEPVNYTNWCGGEPNNFGNAEDYVEMFSVYNGFNPCWNDIQSPYAGTGTPASRGIVELANGVRVNFDGVTADCSGSPFPTLFGAATAPEGVTWNAASGTTRFPTVTTVVEQGMPVTGSKYLRLVGDGTVTLPAGGPLPRPSAANVNEIRVAIPAGTKGVSLAYDFIAVDAAPFNDGMDISVVDVNGNAVAHLVYHDILGGSFANASTGDFCFADGGAHLTPVGPKVASTYLPVLPYPAYLSIVCWNGGDNAASSAVHVDAIQFWGSDKLQLTMSAPFGPGSIRVENSQGSPNTPYWTAITLAQGSYPNGWLFGLDIGLTDLFSQISFGAPFAGTLNASGGSAFTIPNGVPPGIPLYAVSLEFGSQVSASAPKFFITQ